MIKKIAIIGAGGFGRETKWLIDCINTTQQQWDFCGFYDDDLKERKSIKSSLLIGHIDALNNIQEPLGVAIAIGSSNVKEQIVKRLTNKNLYFPTLIHPNCLIGNNVTIDEGTIICASNILTTDIIIKKFVTINLACTIGHDTIIENYCSIMPSVNISGEVSIHQNVYIGTGAKLINQINIGSHSIIGAGAVVINNIPANTTAVGVPAKSTK
jgi:sugar O-acyltransferase (sialic acid O-acetyltransferase NeuD family)